eukprot:TRINITY_DN50078_c0_g1_i1.p1 TRINITY_DN50078_c0_g1~~TRINITY_DN50078_c0_g1_i1.p1  ORF type:complete len:150 (+),score=31.77 TRINITY_DN50078_c0_g1_i1:363-812(+)
MGVRVYVRDGKVVAWEQLRCEWVAPGLLLGDCEGIGQAVQELVSATEGIPPSCVLDCGVDYTDSGMFAVVFRMRAWEFAEEVLKVGLWADAVADVCGGVVAGCVYRVVDSDERIIPVVGIEVAGDDHEEFECPGEANGSPDSDDDAPEL